MTKYIVYIVRTSGNTLYIGQTNNLVRRLAEHHSKKSRGAKYLRGFSDFALIYQETFATRSDALRRELQLKSLTKLQKEKLVKK